MPQDNRECSKHGVTSLVSELRNTSNICQEITTQNLEDIIFVNPVQQQSTHINESLQLPGMGQELTQRSDASQQASEKNTRKYLQV